MATSGLVLPDFAPPPPRIPDYELLRLVGRGAYGDVWLARGVTGVFRAIKVVWRDRFTDAKPYEREFKGLKEFAAVSLLEARQLALLHVGRDDAGRFFYYVMELADDAVTGREIDPHHYVPHTLKELRARRGRLPAAEVIALGLELSRALAGLHARGLVHRDIKPSNVILVGGSPKLADIGLVASSTAAHTFVGTEGYVPPEGPGAPPADVFSLGKLLYELATGLDRQDYPRLPPDFPVIDDRKLLLELNEVLIRACDPLAARRYRDANALSEDLLLLHAGRSVRRLRAVERRLIRAVRVAIGLALIAAIASAGAYVERKRAEEELARREQAERERDDLARRNIYAATLGQAQRALEQDDYGRARVLLEQARSAPGANGLRSLEWQLLAAKAQGDPGRVVLTEPVGITRVVGGPESHHVAVHTAAGALRIVATDRDEITASIPDVASLAGLSRDAQWVIGQARSTGRATRWSLDGLRSETGIELAAATRLIGLTGADELVTFEHAPTRAVVVRDWLGRETQRYPLLSATGTPPWDFFRAASSRDGQRAIFIFLQGRGSDANWRVLAVNFATGRRCWEGVPPGLPTGVGALDSEPAFLLSVGVEARVLKLRKGEVSWQEQRTLGHELITLVEHPRKPGSILSAGRSPVIYELALDSSEAPVRRRGHGGDLSSLFATADGAFLFSGSSDGTLRKWPLHLPSSADGFACWDANGGSVLPFASSPDGRFLAVPSDGQSVAIVEVGSWEIAARWPSLRAVIAWDHDAVWAVNSDSTTIEHWELENGIPARRTKRLVADPLQGLGLPTLSPDGRHLAAATDDGRLWIWSLENERIASVTATHSDAFWNLVFADQGRRIWSVGNDSTLVATDVARGIKLHELAIDGRAPGLAVSPDGLDLALAFLDGRVELRSADTGALKTSRLVSPGLATFVRYTSDGKRLLVGGPAGALAVVSARDATPVVTFSAPTSAAIYQARILPDERWLALVLSTGRVLPWPIAAGE